MSHNNLTINNISIDSDNVPLSLTSMTSTPSSDDVIKYDGSNLVAGASPSTRPYDLKVSNYQIVAGYSVPAGNTYAVGEYVMWRNGATSSPISYSVYSDTGFSRRGATSTNTIATTSIWSEAHNITGAGVYLVTATGTCRNSGANITYQLESNAGAFSAKIYCQENAEYGVLACGILTVTASSDIVRLVIKDQSTTVSLTDDIDGWFFTFNVLKIG